MYIVFGLTQRVLHIASSHIIVYDRRGPVMAVIVWWFDLQLLMEYVPITTEVVSSNPTKARHIRYNIL
jgi:hypothetical protein